MGDSSAAVSRFLIVEGRVQGVGFRWSAAEAAKRLGLVGWVRNTEAGTVEICVEGDPLSIEAFVAWVKKGPPGARVDSVSVRPAAPSGAFVRFSIEH